MVSGLIGPGRRHRAGPGPYWIFIGLVQVAVAVMLLVPRTATLGAGIAEGFTHLLRLRASQLNGCAYCVRLHTRDAIQAGESSDRVSVLPAWRELFQPEGARGAGPL